MAEATDRARATFTRRNRRAIQPTSMTLRHRVRQLRKEVFQQNEKLDDVAAELRETRAKFKAIPDAVFEALGEVRCATCGLETRDAGSGCVQCMDRRRVYDEAREATARARAKIQKPQRGSIGADRCSRCGQSLPDEED